MAEGLRAGTWSAARAGSGWAALLAMSALVACGQSPHAGATYELRISGAPGPAAIRSPGEVVQVVREIDDASTGDRWLLVPGYLGGPGRLLLASRQESAQGGAESTGTPSAPAADRPVIHAGDALIVEEHTAVVEARLEAVALNPAAKGAPLRARLKIGGNVVRAVAVSAGRAVFAPQDEAQP